MTRGQRLRVVRDTSTGSAIAAALRVVANPSASKAERDPAWRTLASYLQTVLPGPSRDDARQEAMIRIARGAERVRASSDGETLSWLRLVAKTSQIDTIRREQRFHRLRADVDTDSFSGDASGGQNVTELDPTTLADTLLSWVEADSEKLAASRATTVRAHALAAIGRVLLGLEGQALHAFVRKEASDQTLYKWTERGRAIVVQSLSTRERDLEELLGFAGYDRIVQAFAQRTSAKKVRSTVRSR